MKKFFTLCTFLVCSSLLMMAQPKKPKLVVGIIVDQMRWDYLPYYESRFGQDGFNRLINGGFSFDNLNINYTPTVTCAGHTHVYTGSVPAISGIAGNNFYIKGQRIYCAEDNTVSSVGSQSKAGKMSPRNLKVTTMTDALRLANDFRSRTISISIKDRSAIMPGGHTANAAYWMDVSAGSFITSSYYMNELPAWLKAFNKKNYDIIKRDVRTDPEGNSILVRLAMEVLDNEKLGQGDETDFLAMSFSSTDYVGHKYGVRSKQTDAIYLNLDKELGKLLNKLDEKVGKGNYLLFLTADHGASHNTDFLRAHRIQAGTWDARATMKALNEHLTAKFGVAKPLVKDYIEYRIYLDHETIGQSKLDIQKVKDEIAAFLKQDTKIEFVVDYENMESLPMPTRLKNMMRNGYNAQRSGDMEVVLSPAHYEHAGTAPHQGTTHGVWNPYDSHIPFVLYGWGIPHGRSGYEATINDIAPTICNLLKIQVPNGSIGKPLPFKE